MKNIAILLFEFFAMSFLFQRTPASLWQKNCEVEFYVSNHSVIDSAVIISVKVDNEVKIESVIINPFISFYWEKFKINLKNGNRRFVFSVQGSEVQKDTNLFITDNTKIFVTYNKHADPLAYHTPQIYEQLVKSEGKPVLNFKNFVDSLYQNGIIEPPANYPHKEYWLINVKY